MPDRHYFFVPPDNLAGNHFFLDEEESHHAHHVLRLGPGDPIWLIDGQGTGYEAVIDRIRDAHVVGTIRQIHPRLGESPLPIHLALSSIHKERLTWAVEKAVELGAHQLSIVHTARSVHRLRNLTRLEAKVRAAAKQCGRSWFPPVKIWTSLDRWLSEVQGTKLVCHSGPALSDLLASLPVPRRNPLVLLVGPEGDFTVEELNTLEANGFQSVSLGPRRLRSETAAITAMALAVFTELKKE